MIKKITLVILSSILFTAAFSQSYNPTLIKDMMDENRSGDVVIHYLKGDLLYVSSLNSDNRHELYVINLKDSTINSLDINNSKDNYSHTNTTFFEYKSSTYFLSKKFSSTLWKTDGSLKNTTEIVSGAISKVLATSKAIFLEVTTDSTGRELYASDGTKGDLRLVKDVYKGTKTSSIDKMTAHNDLLYFVADDSTHGRELWKSDGTTAGTVLVKDFYTGVGASVINSLISFNAELYFTARDINDNNRSYVFHTNGSDTNFVKLIDTQGDSFYTLNNAVVWDTVLYFGGNQAGKGTELCRTNGTTSGTYMITDLDQGTYSSDPEQITYMNGLVYFVANVDKGKELYYTDGTASGTRLTQDLYPIQTDALITHLTAGDSVLYFSAHSSNNYRDFELYSRRHGSFIRKVKDIYPGSTASSPSDFFMYNDKLIFTALDDEIGREIWISDGSSSGTNVLWDVMNATPDNVIASIASTPKGVFFNASNKDTADELWSYDVSTNTITNIIDYNGTTRGQPRELMSTENGVYYSILPGSFDMEINYYDFKTKEITEILDNGKKNYVGSFRRTNGKFFYTLRQTLYNNIWVYDEKAKSTRVVTSSIQPNGFGASAANLTVVGDRVYFTADNYTEGIELYYTDGSTSTLVKDIYNDYYDSRPSFLCSFKDSFIVFSATTPKTGRELYISDGSSSGTELIEIVSGSGSSNPSNMTEGNGVIFFTADDGTNGAELWSTDGTSAGTKMIKDLVSGSTSGNPQNFEYHDDLGLLFFTTSDSNSVETLWSSDGTSAGTKSIYTFTDTSFTTSYSMEYAKSSDKLFFTARTDTTGVELWSTDGKTVSIVSDIIQGSVGSDPQTLTMSNGYLYFTVKDDFHGRELWYMNASCLTGYLTVESSLCEGGSVNPSVSIVSLFDTKSVTYNWYIDDSLKSTSADYKPSFDSSGSYDLKLVLENSEGCNSTNEHTITVYGYPKADFTISQDSQCFKNHSIVFTNTTIGDELTYVWSFGDNTTLSTTNPSKKYSKAGSYNVELIATTNGACSDTSSQKVVVLAEPVTSAINGPNTSDNDKETFTANASTQNSNTFEWAVTNGTIVSGQGTKSIVVKWNTRPTTGIIKLTETSPEGCVGNQVSKTCKVNRNAGISSFENAGITIYPNPSNGAFTIQLDDASQFNQLKVISTLGKVIYTSDKLLSENIIALNLTDGIYFLELTGETVSISKRIVITK